MTRLPKSIKSHYSDSLVINLENLRTLLQQYKIENNESEEVCILISKIYNHKVDYLLASCGDDWNKLELFSSPLIIFVQSIGELLGQDNTNISSECKLILNSYTKTLEAWMIW